MIAQIYTKTFGDYTSVIVSNTEGIIYFHDVIEVPEITGIHRAVSYVKHNLGSDKTEIYPDKLEIDDVLKDVYVNYCKINASAGKTPNEKIANQCSNNLNTFIRWNVIKEKEGNVK